MRKILSTGKKSDRYKPRHAHYLAETQLLIRDLQEIAWPLNYHVTLGGGVLNHGYSDKDIDLYVLPIYPVPALVPLQRKCQLSALVKKLKLRLGEPTVDYKRTAEENAEYYAGLLDANEGSEMLTPAKVLHTCFAESLHYETSNMRIDVFVVRA